MVARNLLEGSQGNILPTDLELMTIDQALICLLPIDSISTIATVSTDEAVAMGLVPNTGKSRVQEVREQQAADERRKRREARRERRKRRT